VDTVEFATVEIIAEEGPHLAGLATRHANENVDSEQH
jgi:hypothetical protein